MGCSTMSKSVQATCNGVKRVGGLDKRIWLGNVNDLDAVANGLAGINSITGLTFKATKGLTRWVGKKEKNNAGTEIESGENLTLRNHSVNLQVYYETAADLQALDELIDQEGVFAIVQTNAGTLEVFGINKVNFRGFGLKASSNTGNSGTVMQDSTAFALTLSGPQTNLQLLYNPGVALDTNIAALDALSIDTAPVED